LGPKSLLPNDLGTFFEKKNFTIGRGRQGKKKGIFFRIKFFLGWILLEKRFLAKKEKKAIDQ